MTPLERLARRILPDKLRRILAKLADRLDELAKTREGAELELHVRVHRDCFREARWDADERIR